MVSESGEVFTWGCNREGQLGYGTSNSGSNYTPRLVEYLKGKVFIGVAVAKYHTIVLGEDGEVIVFHLTHSVDIGLLFFVLYTGCVTSLDFTFVADSESFSLIV